MESRLTILRNAGKNKYGKPLAYVRCSCGTEKVVQKSFVVTGRTKSCGCLKAEGTKERWQQYRAFAFPARLKESAAGCLEWTGPVDPGNGYGQVGYKGKTWRTHRLAYTLAHGPIPQGAHVLHACDNRRCCNPEHLRLGTHEENMRDIVQRGRRKGTNAGAKNGRAKLVMRQVRAIRRAYAMGHWSQERLAEHFGVSQVAISMIVRNKRYTE